MPSKYHLKTNAGNLAELDLAMLEVESLGTSGPPSYCVGGRLLYDEGSYNELDTLLTSIALVDTATDCNSNREFDSRWLSMRKTKPMILPDHSTHFLWPFEGKMMPKIARALINICVGSKSGTVYDPFCGSGTIVLEANLLGHAAIGCDVDPFAAWLTHVKTHPDESFFKQAIQKLNYPTGDARRAVMLDARGKCLPNAAHNVQVYNESCLARPFHGVSAIVTSPPYYDAIDYIERHYEMRAMFNLPNPQTQSVGVGCTIDEYHHQVDQFGVMVAHTLAPGGRTAIVLADHAGVPVVAWHELALKTNGMRHVAKIDRPYVIPTRGIASDVILIYEKPA